MSVNKGNFFVLKGIPTENVQSLILNKSYKDFLSVFYNTSLAFSKKVDELCRLWQTLLIFVKEKSLDDLHEYLKLICQCSLLIVLDAAWDNIESALKTSLFTSMSVSLSQLQETMSDQKDCVKLLSTINTIYEKPWSISFLDKIFNGKQVCEEDTSKYLTTEQGDCLYERIKILCFSDCEDLALNLIDACCLVATGEHKDFLQELHFLLLWKLERTEKINRELKIMDTDEYIVLVDNLVAISELKNICPKAKLLHDCCVPFLEHSLTILIIRCMSEQCIPASLKHVCNLWMKHVLLKISDMSIMASKFQSIADTSSSSAHLYALCDELNMRIFEKENTKPFCIEMLIRALTANANEMENIKNDKENKKRSGKSLSDGFLKLSKLVENCGTIVKECLLTSFSLHPYSDTLDQIKEELENIEGLCKTDIEISTSFSNEGASIGLSQQLCDDMIILLLVHRHASLSWSLKPEDLRTACQTHIEMFEEYFIEKELKYLEIDYSQFDNMPRTVADMYEGIEKGYEHFLKNEGEEEVVEEVSDDDVSDEDYEEELRRKNKKTVKDKRNFSVKSMHKDSEKQKSSINKSGAIKNRAKKVSQMRIIDENQSKEKQKKKKSSSSSKECYGKNMKLSSKKADCNKKSEEEKKAYWRIKENPGMTNKKATGLKLVIYPKKKKNINLSEHSKRSENNVPYVKRAPTACLSGFRSQTFSRPGVQDLKSFIRTSRVTGSTCESNLRNNFMSFKKCSGRNNEEQFPLLKSTVSNKLKVNKKDLLSQRLLREQLMDKCQLKQSPLIEASALVFPTVKTIEFFDSSKAQEIGLTNQSERYTSCKTVVPENRSGRNFDSIFKNLDTKLKPKEEQKLEDLSRLLCHNFANCKI